jgi:hypothetical protein
MVYLSGGYPFEKITQTYNNYYSEPICKLDTVLFRHRKKKRRRFNIFNIFARFLRKKQIKMLENSIFGKNAIV